MNSSKWLVIVLSLVVGAIIIALPDSILPANLSVIRTSTTLSASSSTDVTPPPTAAPILNGPTSASTTATQQNQNVDHEQLEKRKASFRKRAGITSPPVKSALTSRPPDTNKSSTSPAVPPSPAVTKVATTPPPTTPSSKPSPPPPPLPPRKVSTHKYEDNKVVGNTQSCTSATMTASDDVQLVCSGKGGVRFPMGIEITPWEGESAASTIDTASSSTSGRFGHCYTQTSGREVTPIGYIAPRLCLDYNWLHGKSICELRKDAKLSRRRSALFFAAAGGTSTRPDVSASSANASSIVEDHSFSVKIKSEYKKSKNFRIPATASIPLTGIRLAESCSPTFHVVYFEDEHYALNIAHVMYRLIGITRTGLLLKELLTNAFKTEKKQQQRTHSAFNIKFVNVLEIAGRSSGPFMMPFIDTLSPQLFESYQVLPEDGTQVAHASPQHSSSEPQRADVGMAIQLNCDNSDDRQWDRKRYSFKQTLHSGKTHTSPGVQCLDNVVIEHVRPAFHVPFDDRATAAAQYLRSSIVQAWMSVHPPATRPTYITLINRLNSRTIVDVDTVVSSLGTYLNNKLCPAGPPCKGVTVPEVRLVYLETIPKLSDQAALFHESSIVIAVHGAALAWAIAMRENTTVIEIVPPGYDRKVGRVSETFNGLFEALSVNHIPLKMRDQKDFNPRKSKEFRLEGRDLEELRHVVGVTLSSRSHLNKNGGSV